jgi:predicted SAM-dependent methyltransferase
VFKELHRILKANGQVIITVPNLKSLACTIFQSNWIGWDVPRHLLHYTPRTLQHFAEAAGFVVHRLSYQGTAFDWTRSLAAKWYHSEFSPRGLRLRRSLLFNLFFTPIACMADMFRLGDCVTAIIRKL